MKNALRIKKNPPRKAKRGELKAEAEPNAVNYAEGYENFLHDNTLARESEAQKYKDLLLRARGVVRFVEQVMTNVQKILEAKQAMASKKHNPRKRGPRSDNGSASDDSDGAEGSEFASKSEEEVSVAVQKNNRYDVTDEMIKAASFVAASDQDAYAHKENSRLGSLATKVSHQNFEESYKMYLSNEYNAPLDQKNKREQYALDDDDEGEAGALEENKIIMEMYMKDNRDKMLKNSKVRTALSKNPPVPRMKDTAVVADKPRNLPLLKDFKKQEDERSRLEPATELKERIRHHKQYLRELKQTVAHYKSQSEGQDKFDLEKRLNSFMAEKGMVPKKHIRGIARKAT